MEQTTLFTNLETYSDTALAQLMGAPLPQRTESYTPIAHKVIIDNTKQTLQKMGFQIKQSIYRSAMDGQIGSGEYHINFGNDSDMGLMIAWQNSYNKMLTFKYAVGGHVFVCANGAVSGDLGAYRRKHTGDADTEAFDMIEVYLKDAKSIFEQLVYDKEQLKKVNLDMRTMSELMGRMYIEKEIVTSTQLNIMKRELEKPTHDYGVPVHNAWSLYNYSTFAFKEDSPRHWMRRHVDLHNFFAENFDLSGDPVPTAEVQPMVDLRPVQEVSNIVIGPNTSGDVWDMF